MNRRSLFTAATAALAAAMMMGCSSPADTQEPTEETSSTESALTFCEGSYDLDVACDGPGPSRNVYTLSTNIDGAITAINSLGQTVALNFTIDTRFRQANLNRFQPGDPIRPSLLAYNAAVQSHTNILGTLEDLVAFGAHARVSIKTGTTNIRAFRPVP